MRTDQLHPLWLAGLLGLAACDWPTPPPLSADLELRDAPEATPLPDASSPPDAASTCACDDLNPCTTDRCVDGTCEHQAALAAPCDDGDPCTLADRCDRLALCVGTPVSCGSQAGAWSVCQDGACLEVPATDLVRGEPIARASSWWTSGGVVFRGAAAFPVRGTNWFGLETPDNALHGLWSGRGVLDFLVQLRGLGFTALRLPLSPRTLDRLAPAAPWAGFSSGRAVLEEVLTRADEVGLAVVLDVHNCDPDLGAPTGTPTGCEGFELDDWHALLRELAVLALAHPSVMGVEPFNEPFALTWSEWSVLVSAAADTLLTANPHILVFVDGVGAAGALGPAAPAWGENLVEAGAQPVGVPPSRRVYAPHVYGPSVHDPRWTGGEQTVFSDPTFPESAVTVWEAYFGYLLDRGETVLPTEFGDRCDVLQPRGLIWLDRFVSWLSERPVAGFFQWAMNPNSTDTGGLLEDDWRTPSVRAHALQPLLWSAP